MSINPRGPKQKCSKNQQSIMVADANSVSEWIGPKYNHERSN